MGGGIMDTLELGKSRAVELGLQLHISYQKNVDHYYYANDIYRILGDGVSFVCEHLKDSNLSDMHREGWVGHEPKTWPDCPQTHTALLIGIKPIEKDTAEMLLKHFMKWFDDNGIVQYRGSFKPDIEILEALQERAKKLLETK